MNAHPLRAKHFPPPPLDLDDGGRGFWIGFGSGLVISALALASFAFVWEALAR